jgi:hypothetical protein
MGERVDSDGQNAYEDDDDSSCFQDGFIVPDNYFSDSELDDLLLEDGATASKVKHQILLAGRKMEERRQMAFNQKDFQPKVYRDNLTEYSCVGFMALPCAIKKQGIEIQDHLPTVVKIVHGSELTKDALSKEIRKSVPVSNSKVKHFLSQNCVR